MRWSRCAVSRLTLTSGHLALQVEDMNAIAREVLAPFKIPVLDLYTLVTAHCGAVYFDCDICRMTPCSYHYNDAGMKAQAAVVAAAIRTQLNLSSEMH